MDDEDRAIISLQELGTEAAGKVVQAAAKGLLNEISVSAGDIWKGLLGDDIKQWRTRNLINTLEKTAEFIQAKGLKIENAKHLPGGEILAIFEGMSSTEDEELSDLWARLLAEGMTGEENLSAITASGILRQMSPDVATIFKQLAATERKNTLRRSIQAGNLDLRLPQSSYTSDDVDEMQKKCQSISDEIDRIWESILIDNKYTDDYFKIIANELLRLNLVVGIVPEPNLRRSPFRDGYMFNEDGADAVISELQEKIEEIIDNRVNQGEFGIVRRSAYGLQLNFELNALGRALARSLGLLQP